MATARGDVIQFDRPPNLKTIDEVAQWVEAQLRVVERVLNEGAVYVRLVPLSVEPEKPRNGMVVYAITPWNPGSGEGVYAYVNATWELLG